MGSGRRVVVSAFTAALLATVAGCSSGSGTNTPSGTATVTTTRTASSAPPTTSPTTSPTGVATPVTGSGTTGGAVASGPGLCTPTVTRMDVGGDEGGDGHFAFVVHVVNASSSPCATTGYPGVALLDSGGRQAEQASRTLSGYMGGLQAGSTPARIVLQPGQGATALIEGENAEQATGASCPSSAQFLFTLPDNTDSTTLRHTTPLCTGLQVHPLLAGTSGSESSTG